MFKDVLNHAHNFTGYAELGLVIFFVIFAGVAVRTLVRPKSETGRWSRLPLDD